MPWSFLFNNNKHNKNHLHTSSNSIETSINIDTKEEDSEEYNWHELTIEENNSLLTSLNRICIHWHEIIYNKIRSILILFFFSMLNIATRLACFSRQRTLARSTSPLSSTATSSSSRTFEEDINHSSTSLIHFNSQFDLPSSENSTMAHMLVQQQTPNIPIHRTTSTQNGNSLSLPHSFDETISFYKPDSKRLLQFLQRYASEPQTPVYHSTSNNSTIFPFSNTFLPIDGPELNDDDCDKFEPVITEIANSDQSDNISTPTINGELDEDVVLNTNSSLNVDRRFRRRKRRTSLTRTSSSSDDTPPITTDPIEKIDNNNNNQDKKSQEISENLHPVLIENLSLDEKKDAHLVENDESIDKIPSFNFPRRRRLLRYRSNHHTPSVSEESTSDNIIEPIVSTETIISTPPPSPTSPIVKEPLPNTNTNTLTGKLKRNGSVGTTKKMVRFADTVGRELAQVQYIQLLIDDDDDSKEFSFVKNNLYVPKSYNIEHKPWSFDVVSASKPISDTRIAKRFFRLYRQPNSEHPDIYLHDIWRSQIKLEHADIHSKSPLASEQCLFGTLWVTNASYWKNVTVKYTFNRWVNTYEYEAQHRCHSNDFRNIDQFEFSIDIPHDIDRIDFVLRYYVNGQEHWDNNEGKNYTLETQSASTPQTTISLPHDCDFNEMRFY